MCNAASTCDRDITRAWDDRQCLNNSCALLRALAHSAQLLRGHDSDRVDDGCNRITARPVRRCCQLIWTGAWGSPTLKASAPRQRDPCEQSGAGVCKSWPMTRRKALQMFCKGMPAWWLVHTGAWLLRLDLMTPSACQVGLMQHPQILLKYMCSCQVVLCARS